jgi:hypothetical protein
MSSKPRLIPVAIGLLICAAAAVTALQTAQAQVSVPVQTAVYRPAADAAVHVEPVHWYGYGYRSAYRPYGGYGPGYYSYYRPYYRPYLGYYRPYPRVYSYYPGYYYPPVYGYYPRSSFYANSYPAYGYYYW